MAINERVFGHLWKSRPRLQFAVTEFETYRPGCDYTAIVNFSRAAYSYCQLHRCRSVRRITLRIC